MIRNADDVAPQRRVRDLLDVVVNAPETLPALPADDLDMALRLGRRARLLGRVAFRLRANGHYDDLPQVVRDQLDGAMAMARARVRLARWELDRIAWAMGDDALTPLVLMKGCAYEALHIDGMQGRLFADVDLMTGEDDLEIVERTLNSMGWDTAVLGPYDDNYYRKWTHELPPLMHVEREVEIDLHHNVLPRTARLKPDGKALLDRSREIAGTRYRVLADEDIVLHAMVHLMFDSDLGDKLRDLVDIADLLAALAQNNDDFWPTLLARASALGLERPAYYSLRYANRLLDFALPEEVDAAMLRWRPPAPIRSLMDWLVPLALYPQHPDKPANAAALARMLLYMRSHWLRMPPWLLTYHLANKFFRKRILKR